VNRLQTLFALPKEKVIPFLTAGYPRCDSTADLVLAAEQAGVDMIEIGMPFSDPLADGPVIQAASKQALENGLTLNLLLSQLSEIRTVSDIPLVLMGYVNPILNMGMERFLDRCAELEIDGLILPDVPLDEAERYCTLCRCRNISPILLVAPNTTEERIRLISKIAGDLLYATSILGVTGSALNSREQCETYFARVRKSSCSPFVVGFGIRTREDVIWINQQADGAVIGTVLLEKLGQSPDPARTVRAFLEELAGQE